MGDWPRILALHKVTPRLTGGGTNYSPKRLTGLFERLRSEGVRFVSLAEAVRAPRPNRIAVTLDDAYAHLVNSLPALIDRFSLRPHLFVPTGWLGRPNHWDYSGRILPDPHVDHDALRHLVDLGCTVGSHGHTHRDLRTRTDTELAMELSASRAILEEISGDLVTTVAYPFGRVDERVRDAASAAGYQLGFTMAFPRLSDQPLAVGRLPIYVFDTYTSVHAKLNRGVRFAVERIKTRSIQRLSAGTRFWQRLTERV